MKATDIWKYPGPCLEFGEVSLKARDGVVGFELELERQENGRLTLRCRDRLIVRLREFMGRQRWRPRPRVYCAVSARGVSLRRVSLPATTRDETRGLLLLQIEREFPLAPEELAWGYRAVNGGGGARDRSKQELLVVAVKREVIQEYADILLECDTSPVFTLGAFARGLLVPESTGAYAMLDIGRTHSELAIIENGAPESIRVLRWGGEDVTRAIEQRLGISRVEAENLKVQGRGGPEARGVGNDAAGDAIDAELRKFAESIRAHWAGQRLYLTGGGARLPGIASCFERVPGSGAVCERLDPAVGEVGSAAIAGLVKSWEVSGGDPLLVLQHESVRDADRPGGGARWKWAAVGGLVILGLLSIRYTEALLMKPRLERRLSEVQAYRESLPEVEGELVFLQYLKTNQPAYLDTLFVLADAAPPGTRIDSLSMNRRGELAMRSTLRDPQQVAAFRSKLVQSGVFESIALEEQVPGPHQQNVMARFAGRWGTRNDSP